MFTLVLNIWSCGIIARVLIHGEVFTLSVICLCDTLDSRFCLVTGIPGSVMLKFFISDLQCYGAIRNKFCFQVKSDYNSTPPGSVNVL
ncbi:hypothetical protein D918_06580 [Trichuris suis]|nr:hypothetical protein D918_06580 [Trichuris suis]